MPASVQVAGTAGADTCVLQSTASDSQTNAQPASEARSPEKFGVNGGSSDPPAARPSKRFVDEDSKSPEYRSDAWRMSNFKVVPCSKRYAHDWTICPFAHPGEKARRRDPRIFTYAGIACPDMKKAGFCSRGDKCPYAHNVFEFWLHPTRYRTQLCNDGPNCTRHVCFFAHTIEEMRAMPGKPMDGKRDARKGEAVSPDTPFMQCGTSIHTTSSTASTEVWSILMPEDRCRSTGLPPDDLPKPSAQNGLIDELANSLANVKLAMSSEKREEVISMLATLLQEAAEDKRIGNPDTNRRSPTGAPGLAERSHAAELSLALSALDRSQAHSLLADTNRRNIMASQLAKCAPENGQDWRHIVQQILDGTFEAPSRAGSARLQSPLFTAPAAVDMTSAPDAGTNLSSRVLSADLGTMHHHSFWQSAGAHDLPSIPRGPSNHMLRCVSGDVDASPRQLNVFPNMDDSLFSGAKFATLPSANPSALRKQSFDMDDAMPPKPQPRREVRRPPISAFQSAAVQDWKQPDGRVPNTDLRWASSGGRLSSSDLATINEGLTPLSYCSTDLFNQPNVAAKLPFATTSSNADRSKSSNMGGFEPTFNLLPAPLAFPTTQPGGRDTSALHTAPYDLSFAYGADRDLGLPQRQSMDQPQLQGWGGLSAQDFSLGRF